MERVFSRAEVDFWCNHLGNEPTEMFTRIAAFRESGEAITINEVRRTFKIWGEPFPDRPDGDVLLDGTGFDNPNTPEYKAELIALAQFAKNLLQENAPATLAEPKYAKLAELLASSQEEE